MKRKSRYRWGLLMLAAILCVALALMGGTALAEEGDCSVTVTLPDLNENNAELLEGASAANLVVDLYKMADLADNSEWAMLEPYSDLVIPENGNSTQLEELAEQAAKLSLQEGSSVKAITSGASLDKEITAADTGESLKSGLYLIVVHGSDLQNYLTTMTTAEGTKKLVTIARSGENIYTFKPQLVTLTSEGQKVQFKPTVDKELGGLEIVKTLDPSRLPTDGSGKFNSSATFSFNVEAKIDGESVYSNIVPIEFKSGDELTKRVVLPDQIPKGAEVTISEVSIPSRYSLIGDNDKKVTIPVDGIASVEFKNRYTPPSGGGGGSPPPSPSYSVGIVNTFKYHEGEGWEWVLHEDE